MSLRRVRRQLFEFPHREQFSAHGVSDMRVRDFLIQFNGLLHAVEISIAIRTLIKMLLDLPEAQRVEFQVKMVQHMPCDICALDVRSSGSHVFIDLVKVNVFFRDLEKVFFVSPDFSLTLSRSKRSTTNLDKICVRRFCSTAKLAFRSSSLKT